MGGKENVPGQSLRGESGRKGFAQNSRIPRPHSAERGLLKGGSGSHQDLNAVGGRCLGRIFWMTT